MKLTDIILEKINGDGIGDPKIDFDVKGISISYTDYGDFYGIYLYDDVKANSSWKEKIRFFDDAQEYIKGLTGLELPRDYYRGPHDTQLEDIKNALIKKGYEADYDNAMDVS